MISKMLEMKDLTSVEVAADSKVMKYNRVFLSDPTPSIFNFLHYKSSLPSVHKVSLFDCGPSRFWLFY